MPWRPHARRLGDGSGLWFRFDPAQPNAGHRALAAFAQRHPGALTVVTQNVDDLHQRAGNGDAIRLHGDILHDRWLETGACRAQPACDVAQATPGTPPRCPHC